MDIKVWIENSHKGKSQNQYTIFRDNNKNSVNTQRDQYGFYKSRRSKATPISISHLFILYFIRFGLGLAMAGILSLCDVLFESDFKIFISTTFTKFLYQQFFSTYLVEYLLLYSSILLVILFTYLVRYCLVSWSLIDAMFAEIFPIAVDGFSGLVSYSVHVVSALVYSSVCQVTAVVLNYKICFLLTDPPVCIAIVVAVVLNICLCKNRLCC